MPCVLSESTVLVQYVQNSEFERTVQVTLHGNIDYATYLLIHRKQKFNFSFFVGAK
jgi:hypothetical protein